MKRVGAHAQVIGGHGRVRKRRVEGQTATDVLSRETQSCRMASAPVSTELGTSGIKVSATPTISSDIEDDTGCALSPDKDWCVTVRDVTQPQGRSRGTLQ